MSESFFFPLSVYISQIDIAKCDKCLTCRDVCVRQVIDDNLSSNYLECSGCGTCVLACPSQAMRLIKRSGIVYKNPRQQKDENER